MRKIPGLFILLFIVLAAALNSGTVRRKQNPVSKAQTAGIKLTDKLEELKDGEKGPATPSFGWYGGKNGFMGDPPFSEEAPVGKEDEQEIPLVSEIELPQQGSAADEEEQHDDSGQETWGEDWEESVGVKEDEALPITADTEGAAPFQDTDSSLPSDTPKDEKASKWDKDWWDEI